MKVIILLAGYGKRMRPYTWSRPKPILRVAGNTVVGHILDMMSDITTEEVVFVVGYKGAQIEDWIRENYPDLDTHFVVQEQPLGQAHAVWLCGEYLDDGDRLIGTDHPLSFRRFMEDSLFSRLDSRPLPENILFPDPSDLGGITRLITEIRGADMCWGGLGITGHFAFNDLP